MVFVRFLWGGLQPIAVQVVLDGLALISFGAVAIAKPPASNSISNSVSTSNSTSTSNGALLQMIATLLAVVFSSGGNLTNRWTIVFPMLPFMVLQTLRHLLLIGTSSASVTRNESEKKAATKATARNTWKLRSIALWIIGISSGVLLFVAASLTILFPAVELPLPDDSHIYNVGVVDLFLPKIHWNNTLPPLSYSYRDISFDPSSYQTDHFAIRVLYPTTATTKTTTTQWMPYLRPSLSHAYCEVNMKQGAPPPLKHLGWFVHYWNLIQLPASPNAPVLAESLLPIVVYSPGLGGTAETYSYQTLSLAARGFVVVVLEHGDGSLAVIPRKDGGVFRRSDDTVVQDWKENRKRHDRSRRAMTDYRSEEIVAATKFMVELSRTNIPELESNGVNFVGTLDIHDLHYMGHSFGGASVIHAAYKLSATSSTTTNTNTNTHQQGLYLLPKPRSIIAHDPVSNWIPDSTRLSLFDTERLNGSTTNYTRWTTPRDTNDDHHHTAIGANEEQLQPPPSTSSIHDFDLFLMFSHQWGHHQWEGVEVLQDMQNRGTFGRGNGLLSKVEIANSAHHIEFSDLSMITPTWLARGVNMTGEQSPLKTAKDIHTRTLNFLMEVRGQEGFVNPSTNN